jgi:hypothetical protein
LMNMNNTFNHTFGEFFTPEGHLHIPIIPISPFLHAVCRQWQNVWISGHFHAAISQQQ